MFKCIFLQMFIDLQKYNFLTVFIGLTHPSLLCSALVLSTTKGEWDPCAMIENTEQQLAGGVFSACLEFY